MDYHTEQRDPNVPIWVIVNSDTNEVVGTRPTESEAEDYAPAQRRTWRSVKAADGKCARIASQVTSAARRMTTNLSSPPSPAQALDFRVWGLFYVGQSRPQNGRGYLGDPHPLSPRP